MGKLSIANLKKTLYYLQRNGLKSTFSAAKERLEGKPADDYTWLAPDEEQLLCQKKQFENGMSDILFSIVVPTFRTNEKYLRRMMESVLAQTYGRLELILCDATDDDSVEKVVKTYQDSRIVYRRLQENKGIADNTNEGIAIASGDYIGLLDHDDVLTPDALFECASCISRAEEQGITLKLLYSDEDKCDGEETCYFDPNWKEDFNLDLLLSNNYICHFLVLQKELMQQLLLRRDYDGAQDYDLVLRAAAKLKEKEQEIAHIRKVLYHWRCHSASTAENPQSKRYAYEAGLRAVEDFAKQMDWKISAEETKHLGFYRYIYSENPMAVREDLGAVGGPLVQKGHVIGGRMSQDGTIFYENLPTSYSGYLHRASLQQDAEVLDIRNLKLRESLQPLFEQVVGTTYRENTKTGCFDDTVLPKDTDWKAVSIRLCLAIRSKGYRLLYLPDQVKKLSDQGK